MLFPDWDKKQILFGSATSGTYTVPFDGYVHLFAMGRNGGCYVMLNGVGIVNSSSVMTFSTEDDCNFLPVKKGDKFTVTSMIYPYPYNSIPGQGSWEQLAAATAYIIPFKH